MKTVLAKGQENFMHPLNEAHVRADASVGEQVDGFLIHQAGYGQVGLL